MFGTARKLFLATALATAGLAATPAAASTVVDPCSATWVQGGIACVGYYGGNLIRREAGQSTPADVQALLAQLLSGPATNSTGAYNPPYTLNYGTILGAIPSLNGSATATFTGLTLSGLTIVGIHFGNTPDAGGERNTTAFWLLDLGNTRTSTINISSGQGSSGAQVFATGGVAAVPEPGTWALMLLGFGAIGAAMRRRRKTPAMLQLA